MKRVFSLFLVFILSLSLCVSVSAGGNTGVIRNLFFIEPEGFEKINEAPETYLYSDGKKALFIYCVDGIGGELNLNNNSNSIKLLEKSKIDKIIKTLVNEEEATKPGYLYNVDSTSKIKSRTGNFKKNSMNVDMYVYEMEFTTRATGYTDYNGYYRFVLMLNKGTLYVSEYTKEINDTKNIEALEKYEDSFIFENYSDKNTIKIHINGEYIRPDSNPVIVDDRVLVPIRAVAEKLEYKVGWEPENRQVDIYNGEKRVVFVIDSKKIKTITTKGVEEKEIDVPAQIMSDRTYLPVRAVGEALGCKVDWDADNRTVIITR